MRLDGPELTTADAVDLCGKRLLIFIVAYNAETTIERVLARIPASLHSENVEVLIIDDFSKDNTFSNGLRFQQRNSALKITVFGRRRTKDTAEIKNWDFATRSTTGSISWRWSMATDSTPRRNCPYF